VLKRREFKKDYGVSGLTKEQRDNLCNVELSRQLSYIDKKRFVRSHLLEQVGRLLNHVEDSGGISPFPIPIFKDEVVKKDLEQLRLEHKQQLLDEYFQKKTNDFNVSVFSPGVAFAHPDGFSLQIRKSNVEHPESGYGLWVSGQILPGTLIAFYPGSVYLIHKLTKNVIVDNDYMINRYDDVVIDGKNWALRAYNSLKQIQQFAMARGEDESSLLDFGALKFRNQFGVGNYINHPPKDVLPNVAICGIDFYNDDLKNSHKHLLPNFFAQQHGFFDFPQEDLFMKSIVIVAKRSIVDEELFLNYRFNPRFSYPDWYYQPNEEEARRRWSRRTIL
jgi:hypothetical protein